MTVPANLTRVASTGIGHFVRVLRSRLQGVTRRDMGRVAALMLAISAVAWLRVVMSFPIHRDSDDANNFLAGLDVASGNWNLHGWIMAPDSLYTTDVLIQALLTGLFGATPFLMRLSEAILWALIVFVGIQLARKGGRPLVSVSCAILTLLTLTFPMDAGPMSFMTMVSSHASSILLGLLTFKTAAAIYEDPSQSRHLRCSLLALYVFLGSLADPIYTVMACLPILLVCGVQSIGSGWRGARGTLLVTVVGGIILAKFGHKVIEASGGFASSPLELKFASFPDMLDHVGFAFQGIATLLGTNFAGRTVDGSFFSGPYLSMLRFPFLIAFLLALMEVGRHFMGSFDTRSERSDTKNDVDFLDHVLFASVALSATSAIVTTAINDPYHLRYFMPATTAGVVLLARRYAGVRAFSLFAKIAFLASLVFVLHAVYREPKQPRAAQEQIMALRDVLQSQGLHQGYAGYWQSSIITAMTGTKLKLLAVSGEGDEVRPYGWFTNLDWYRRADKEWQGKVFFVGMDEPRPGMDLPHSAVIRKYGQPDQILRSGPFVISVYYQGEIMNLPVPDGA